MAGTLTVQNLQGPSSGANANKIIVPSGQTLDASSATLIPSVDQILQSKTTYFGDTTAHTTNNTYIACSGSDTALTTIADNSKFLVLVHLNIATTAYNNGYNAGVIRGSTLVAGANGGSGDAWAGGNNDANSASVDYKSGNVFRQFIDSPSLSAGTSVTYKAAVGRWTSGTITVNYTGYNVKSSITVMEIAQ